VLSQLRYVGLLETVRVRRAGFSVRIVFKDFIHRYGFLMPSAKSADLVANSQKILERYPPPPFFFCLLGNQGLQLFSSVSFGSTKEDYAIGKTKVFMKNSVENALEGSDFLFPLFLFPSWLYLLVFFFFFFSFSLQPSVAAVSSSQCS